MLDAIKHGLGNIINFTGRDARQPFWYYVLFAYIATTMFSMSSLMAGLDDEIRALAQAILARPSPDLARISPERITYAVDRCLLRLKRIRLDERADWVGSELLAAEGRGERETVIRLLDLQRQNLESRRAVDRQIEQATVLVRA